MSGPRTNVTTVVAVVMVVAVAVAVAGPDAANAAATALPSAHVDGARISVSGISSGAFMAVQLHVAFSSRLCGVGVVAGGPYWCAAANAVTAETVCMRFPTKFELATAWGAVTYAEALFSIDRVSHLKGTRVYVFAGTGDTVVHPQSGRNVAEFYARYTDQHNIATKFDVPAEHAFITRDKGNACGFKGPKYVNHCDFDLASEMLQHIYPESRVDIGPPGADTRGFGPAYIGADSQQKGFQEGDAVLEFDQHEFGGLGMADTGFVFIPAACRVGGSGGPCALHVALHGCLQSAEEPYVHRYFVENTGYLEAASRRNIVVLFPQASTKDMLNPKGCWDWWGFTGPEYATKLAPQMTAIMKMVDRLAVGPAAAIV